MKNVKRKMSEAFTLVEVLVAMLVLAIGLLGLAGITVVVLRSNTLSQQMTEATTLASNLMEALRQAPSVMLVDCQTTISQATAQNASTCPALAESGIGGASNTAFLPPAASDTGTCVIRGLLDGAPSSTAGNQITFDSVSASWTPGAVSGRSQPGAGASICTTAASLGQQYIRYYRTIRLSGGAGVTEYRLISVVLWRDKFNKWRSVKLDTRRTTN